MNPLNYASLEAARRLVEAGIVMETDWFYDYLKELHLNRGMLGSKIVKEDGVPSPSPTEVLNELPEGFNYDGVHAYLSITKSRKGDGTFFCGYYLPDDRAVCGSVKHNINLSDALIDLLIWVKQSGKEK